MIIAGGAEEEMKSGLKKPSRYRFPPRWTPNYPFAWLGLGTSLDICRKSKSRLASKVAKAGGTPRKPK